MLWSMLGKAASLCEANVAACIEQNRPQDRYGLSLTDRIGGHKGSRGVRSCQVLGFEVRAVGGEDESRLRFGGSRAGFQRGQRLRNLARRRDGDMDVVRLQNPAQVGLVRRARPQPLDRRFLVPECLQEGERKLLSIEEPLSQRRNRFFNLDGVQLLTLAFCNTSLALPGANSLPPAPWAAILGHQWLRMTNGCKISDWRR